MTRNLRFKMMLTTASAALMAIPGAAHAQLVSGGDLVTAQDSAGNPGQITISNPDAKTANISVLAPVVIANWNRFNVPVTTTLNVSNASAAAQASLLNRVIGGTFSDIGGTINAVGVNLWLVNQNGILFGGDASVNATSFFASTLGVTDQDFFDYYQGTNIAGNGSQTVRFSGAGTTVINAQAGASFVTDGSLFFTGSALDLDATFDAGSGSVSFVAARDASVNFNAGSPVSYTVNSGTVVAQQAIGGTITGQSANFVLFNDAAVVNGLLQIDADVTTTALPSANGVFIVAAGAAGKPDAVVNGTINSSGVVSAVAQRNLTFNDSVTGSFVFLPAAGALSVKDVTATAGTVDLDGSSITAGALAAAGDVQVDSAGAVSIISAMADSDLSGAGSLLIGSASTPTSVTVTGAARGASVDIAANGALALGSVTSTSGLIDLDSTGGTISATAVSANGGDASLTTTDPGGVTTSSISASGAIDVDSSAGGNLNLGALDAGAGIALDTTGSLSAGTVSAGGALSVGAAAQPSSANFSGAVTANGVAIRTAGALNAQDIDAGAGGITISAGSVTADDLLADQTIEFSVANTGSIALGSIVSTAGDVFIPNGLVPLDITVTGETRGNRVAIVANGDIDLGKVVSTAGSTTIQSGNGAVSTGDIAATGGAAVVSARNSVTTGAIASTANVAVGSTGGGALDLGNLASSTGIAVNTTGSLSAGSAITGGALLVGGVRIPSTATFSNDISAASVDIEVTGALSAQGVASNGGAVSIAADSIEAGVVSADGGDASLTAAGPITTSGINTSGSIDVASTAGGAVDVGALAALGDIALDTTGTLAAGSVQSGGALTVGAAGTPSSAAFSGNVTAQAVDFDIAGAFQGQSIVSTAGAITIDAGSVSAGSISANGGNAVLTSTGAITTDAIASSNDIDVASTAGGNLALGQLTAGGDVALDTSGNLSANTTSAGGRLDVGAASAPGTATFAGDVSAVVVNLAIEGSLDAQAITARDGHLELHAGSVASGALKATDDVSVDAAGAVMVGSAIADSDGSGAGNLAIGANALPESLSVREAAQGVAVGLQASGAVTVASAASTAGDVSIDSSGGSIATGSVVATGGDALLTAATGITATSTISGRNVAIAAGDAVIARDIGATAGSVRIDASAVNAQAVTATDDVTIEAAGDVALASVLADSDASGAGDLAVGATTAPAQVFVANGAQGASVELRAKGNLALGTVTSTNGALTIDSGTGAITAAQVSATGGDASLGAAGDVITTSLGSSGAIGVTSTQGGGLNLGPLTAGGAISLDTTGTLFANTTSAGGALSVGAGVTPAAATFAGDVTARVVDIRVAGPLDAEAITATDGHIDIDAGSAETGALTATDDVLVDAPGGLSTGETTADSDNNGQGSVRIPANTP